MAALVRPRLLDHFQIAARQEDLDFAVPFLDEDIPLYVDPFLLWKSPAQQDQALHTTLLNSFNHLVHIAAKGNETDAKSQLIIASECNEVGLGTSKSRSGHRIGDKTAQELVDVFKTIPHIAKNGFTHHEEIQFYVDNISKDRISDFTCSFLKSFLVDFTIDQCQKLGIPLTKTKLTNIYNTRDYRFEEEEVGLPVNPLNGKPILLTPKRWLRFTPWLNYDDYFEQSYLKEAEAKKLERGKVAVLSFNRNNYDIVSQYIKAKEAQARDCRNDPLFKSIPVTSAKGKLGTIQKLPSGKTDNADKKYEDHIVQLFASLFYPELDFAAEQSRVDSGTQIRDLIFYNNKQTDFLEEIWNKYGSRQIVFEIKNVAAIERDHINQLNRYMNENFGAFGVLVTRNPLSKQMLQNTIDLWSGQRRCIIAITDADLEMMVDVFESKQRKPIEVLKKKYVEFVRSCPA